MVQHNTVVPEIGGNLPIKLTHQTKNMCGGIEGQIVKAYLLFPGGSKLPTIHYQVDSAVNGNIALYGIILFIIFEELVLRLRISNSVSNICVSGIVLIVL